MFSIMILAALPRVFAFEKVLTEIRCALDGWEDVPHGRDGAEQGVDGKLFEFDCQKKCYDSNGWEGKSGRKMVCGYTYRDAAKLNDGDHVIVDVKSTINENWCGDNNYDPVANWDAEGFRARDSNRIQGYGQFYLCYRKRSLGDVKNDPNEEIVTELIARPSEEPVNELPDWEFIGKWDNHDWRDAWAWANTQDRKFQEQKKTRYFIELHEKKAQLEKEIVVISQWKFRTKFRKMNDMKEKVTFNFKHYSKQETEEDTKKYWEKKVKHALHFGIKLPLGHDAELSAGYDYTNEEKNTREDMLKEKSIETFDQEKSFEYEYTVPAAVDGEDRHMNWWYWSVKASDESGTEWAEQDNPANARERTGCGYDIAPNCLPGYCQDDECWVCTQSWAIIDKNFKYPAQCQGKGKGCEWIGISSDQCPSGWELQNLPACMMDMKDGDRCQVFHGQLPNKENGEINNCDGYDVFEYTCGYTAPNGGDFFTMTGDCDVQGDCVSSANYPGLHGTNEECSITMLRDASVSVGSVFHVETCCDHLLINGIDVESSSMVPASVSARDTITWSSDFSLTTEGWQLCFAKPDGGQKGDYECSQASCFWNKYQENKDWGKYEDLSGDCKACTERCDTDPNCWAVECGGDYCSWWKPGICEVLDADTFSQKTCRTSTRTEESSLNAYSALNSSEDFVVYGLAFVGLITILVLLRSTFQKNDYKAIDEASKLKISSAEL